MNDNLTAFLEEIAANAWPSVRTQHLDGWRLRYSEDVHSRANSVWPNVDHGQMRLVEKMGAVEAFYKRYGLPARYQISPASEPSDLDDILKERGFALYETVEVQTAVLDHVLACTKPAKVATTHTTLSDDWLAFDNRVAQHAPHRAQIRKQIILSIAPETAFVAVYLEGQIAGIGLGVYERGWLGIFNMLTAPIKRGQGVGTAVLHALSHWAKQQGANHVYLQVVATNTSAQSLYQRTGFTPVYTYHYRVNSQRRIRRELIPQQEK